MMVVGWSSIKEVANQLSAPGIRSVDTETTGLRPFHGDRLFSIIIGDRDETFYFNFHNYTASEEVEEEHVLSRSLLPLLQPVFANPQSKWFAHKANFDQHMLAQEGLFIGGIVHCTMASALLEFNDHMSYSLGACLERIGLKKDDAVEQYIKKHGLTEKRDVPGKNKTHKFFDRVPFKLIVPYGVADGEGTRALGAYQEKVLREMADATPNGCPTVQAVLANERRFTKTAFRMERHGLLIDPSFCERARQFELDRGAQARSEFRASTGVEFAGSEKCLAPIFASEKDKWVFTDKGNPSFAGDVIEKFENPAARIVETIRDAKARHDFFKGFLYHADATGRIHSTLNQDGAGHGRTSSSDPNLQNLKKKKDEEAGEAPVEFEVKRAFIPSPGFFFASLDWNQIEYRLVVDLAEEMGMVKLIRDEGLDPHKATAQLAGITRYQAKPINFGILYGEGLDLLAFNLKVPRSEAARLRGLVLGAIPAVAKYDEGLRNTAAARGFIFNWFGRRCYFPDRRFAYRALNHAIAGGAADVAKIACNQVDEYLLDKKSRLVWLVHDELLLEVAYGEEYVVDAVKKIMETAYPHKHLPLTASADYSEKSWADLSPWEARGAA